MFIGGVEFRISPHHLFELPSVCALIWWNRNISLYLCIFALCTPSQKCNSHVIMKQISDQYHLRNISQNIWPVFLKTDNVLQNKKRLKKYQSHQEPKGKLKETWQVNVTWLCGWNPGPMERHWVKTKQIWIQSMHWLY